jgi:hypothetical protein
VAWTCPELYAAPYLHGLRFTGVTPVCRDRVQALLAHDQPQHATRLYCGLAATCQRKGVRCPLLPSSIRDLSDRGVGLRIPELVAPGTELCIRTTTAFGPIAADAQVVWTGDTGQRPRGALYRHGVRLLRLDPSSDLPLQACCVECGERSTPSPTQEDHDARAACPRRNREAAIGRVVHGSERRRCPKTDPSHPALRGDVRSAPAEVGRRWVNLRPGCPECGPGGGTGAAPAKVTHGAVWRTPRAKAERLGPAAAACGPQILS